MSQIKKILCPTDFGEPSRVALQAAVKMARLEEAELTLLHVLPPLGPVRGIAAVEALAQSVENEAHQKLEALLAECVPPGVRARPLVRVGEEAEEIHRAARQADVVVMSTHGRAGWGHWTFGTVAQSVFREAACPIFVVGPSAANDKAGRNGRHFRFDFPFQQVLWPTDWSAAAERALDEAIVIAAHHDAQLIMLHVIEPREPESEDRQQEQDAAARELFRDLRASQPATQDARRLICHGIAAPEIIRVAIAESADLIVMGSYGRTIQQKLSTGSVTQKVLRLVPCPVFLVPYSAALPSAEPLAEV
jgi:nucleotide-binding universal stress UspA family protein